MGGVRLALMLAAVVAIAAGSAAALEFGASAGRCCAACRKCGCPGVWRIRPPQTVLDSQSRRAQTPNWEGGDK